MAGLSPHDARLFPIQADLRGPGLLDALAGMDAVIHLAAQKSLSGRLMGRCERFL
jgi:hypothetical protein